VMPASATPAVVEQSVGQPVERTEVAVLPGARWKLRLVSRNFACRALAQRRVVRNSTKAPVACSDDGQVLPI